MYLEAFGPLIPIPTLALAITAVSNNDWIIKFLYISHISHRSNVYLMSGRMVQARISNFQLKDMKVCIKLL